MTSIMKLWTDFKPLILVFLVFFGLAYSAIRLDQYMGWEKQRTERNLTRIKL